MKQIHHTNNGNEYLFVELPEHVTNIKYFSSSNRIGCNSQDFIFSHKYFQLPPGNWQLLGKVSELTEEQFEPMLYSEEIKGIKFYRDYFLNQIRFVSANLAMAFLVKYLKITPGNWIALKINRE